MPKAGKVILGILGAVGAFLGIRYLIRAAPEEYVCPICGEPFATYEELKTHFETAHESELIEIVWD